MLWFLLLVTVAISYWNARVAGLVWVETQAVGGFIRTVVWSAAIQSVLGFSLLTIIPIMSLLPDDWVGTKLVTGLFSLVIILGVWSTGCIITIYSWIEYYREKSLAGLSVASYNSFATAYNTFQLVDDLVEAIGGVFSVVADIFDFDDEDWPVALVVIIVFMILAVTFGAGILFTRAIIQYYAGTLPLPATSVEKKS